MLTKEQNARLTRVGADTPMGRLMRRYWQPIAASTQLDDNPVLKVRILGEDLVLYRSAIGRLGLIGNRCAHRSVSLEFGIPDVDGLRCPYHGWCYDETGQCVDTPLESPRSRLKDNVRLTSYPVRELGGLVFAYLGPGAPPLLPPWDLLVWPNSVRQIGITTIPCNWLQCQENAADPAHSVFLHGHYFKYVLERQGLIADRAPDPDLHRAYTSIRYQDGFDKVVYKEDRYGLQKGMRYTTERGAPSDFERWHAYMIFPNLTRPAGGAGVRHEFQMRVPIDDENTLHFNYTIFAAPTGVEAPHQDRVPYYVVPTHDQDGKPILDFVLAQDIMAWSAQGAITDRAAEHLAGSDVAILAFRRMLEEQLRVMESGADPMNVFRDPTEIGDRIDVPPPISDSYDELYESGLTRFRAVYHQGYWRDDADRYGPDIELVLELSRRIEAQTLSRS